MTLRCHALVSRSQDIVYLTHLNLITQPDELRKQICIHSNGHNVYIYSLLLFHCSFRSKFQLAPFDSRVKKKSILKKKNKKEKNHSFSNVKS